MPLTFDKVLALVAAFTSIAKMVDEAQKDKKITADEVTNIILAGIIPVLQLFGVKLPDNIFGRLGPKSLSFMADVDSHIHNLPDIGV